MMRKIRLIGVAIALVLALAACGNNSQSTGSASGGTSSKGSGGEAAPKVSEEKSFKFTLGTIREDSDPTTLSARKFAELVEEKSGGSIKIEVFSNSVLGGINDMFVGMQDGTVDMMYEGISSYGWMEGAKAFNIMSAPFLWKSYEDMVRVMETDYFRQLFDEAAAATGVRVIKAIGDTEARQLTANRAVRTADDFKGLKVRTAESKIVQETMKKLGANPVVIPFADLYMALRQGVADAQENGFITVQNKSFYEVQTHLMKTDYIRDVKSWYISEAKWQQLSDNQRAIMIEAATEAGNYQTELARKQIEESLEFLKTKMEYVEPDMDSIRQKLEGVLDQFEGDLWPDGMLEKVKELQG